MSEVVTLLVLKLFACGAVRFMIPLEFGNHRKNGLVATQVNLQIPKHVQ